MSESYLPPVRTNLFANIQSWFYAKETPYALALLRITYPLALLVAVLPRTWHVRELYSTDGSPAPFWWSYGISDLLPIFPPEVAMALYAAMIFFLLAASCGWRTRWACGALTILVPYFGMLDALSTLTKYTVFSFHLLLLLSLSECGSVWSVDAWLQRRRHADWKLPQVEVWPQRLIQLLIGFVYLGSAVTKTHTDGFFSGDQMYFWLLTNLNFPNPLGEWVSLSPSLLVGLGFMTAAWELLFLFLVWKEPTRKVMLGIGILFHLMTYFMLGLLVFPLLFMSAYACFLTESEGRRLGQFFASLFPRIHWVARENLVARVTAWPAFAGLLVVTSVVAIAAERKMDVYGERRAEGPHQLRPLPAKLVEEMLRNDTTVAVQDQLYSIDLGTQMVGGFVGNPRQKFQPGETIVMQTRFHQPHSDMWVEYNLRDPSRQVLARDGKLAPREESRGMFRIPLGSKLAPGEYEVQILINGFPAGIRRFRLAAGECSVEL